MKLNDAYNVWTTDNGVSEIVASYFDFIDAMKRAEQLVPDHDEVAVVFTSRHLCKHYKMGVEQVTRQPTGSGTSGRSR